MFNENIDGSLKKSPNLSRFEYSVLKSGVQPYIDRNYVYVKFPKKLEDKPFIVTAMDDKFSNENELIKFNVDRKVTIYIAHNDCYNDKPSWLSQFRDTGESVVMTSYENTLDSSISLYAREFSAGSISLGGNVVQGETLECGMYSVIIADN
jgi:hypothetical protein